MSHSPSYLAPQQSRSAALLAGLTLVAALALTAAQAHAEDLIVKFDQSQLLRLPRPAAEIIIGNPAVADVAIQTGNLLVITGKSFGITNIIALDAERNVIQDQRVLVRRDEVSAVHVYKGVARSTYNCAPQCNFSIMPGDDEKHFQASVGLATAKIGFSEKAADSAAAAGNQQ
jgi:Pilus formation protein N terminal region